MKEVPLAEMLPHDAELVWEDGTWQVHFSAATHCLYFYVGEYHATPLALGPNELMRLLKEFEKVPWEMAGEPGEGIQKSESRSQKVESEAKPKTKTETKTETEKTKTESQSKSKSQAKLKAKPERGWFGRKK